MINLIYIKNPLSLTRKNKPHGCIYSKVNRDASTGSQD